MRKWLILSCTLGYALTMCIYQVYAKSPVESPVWSAVFFGAYLHVVPILFALRKGGEVSKFETYCVGHFLILFLTVQLYYLICLFSMPVWVYSNNVFFGCFIIFNVAYYIYRTIILTKSGQ